MADYDSSLPVRTQTNGDVASKIVDGTTVSQVMEVKVTKEAMVSLREPASGNIVKVNADGSINTNVVTVSVGDDKQVYGTTVAAVPNTPGNVISYTVTAAKTFLLKAVSFAASGKAKFELKTGVPASETTKAVGFISTSNGVFQWTFEKPIEVVATDKILVVGTNKDNQNQDLYAFINGEEVTP